MIGLAPLIACAIVAALLAVVFCPAALFAASCDRDAETGAIG